MVRGSLRGAAAVREDIKRSQVFNKSIGMVTQINFSELVYKKELNYP